MENSLLYHTRLGDGNLPASVYVEEEYLQAYTAQRNIYLAYSIIIEIAQG